MKTKLTLIICIFLICLQANAANKQIFFGIHGAEIGEFIAEKGSLICYDYPNYYVVAKGIESQVGTNILIKFKNKGIKYQCNYLPTASDYEIKNTSAEYFYGIVNNLLFIDSGTGPSGRQILIYDLNQRKLKYKNFYEDAPKIINKKLLSYWIIPNAREGIKKYQASPTNCPEFAKINSQGFTPVIEKHVILDLTNFNYHETGEIRCAGIQ